jgi:hypothetical protein
MRDCLDRTVVSEHSECRTPVRRLTFAVLAVLTAGICTAVSSCSDLTVKAELDTLLVQDGDLPGTLKGGSVSTDMAELVPAPERTLTRKFQKDGRPAGYVQISIFTTVEQAKEALEYASKKLSSPTSVPYMDGAHTWFNGDREGQVVFRKCRGVIHIDMRGMNEQQDARNYADKLMQRISSYVCEEKSK